MIYLQKNLVDSTTPMSVIYSASTNYTAIKLLKSKRQKEGRIGGTCKIRQRQHPYSDISFVF